MQLFHREAAFNQKLIQEQECIPVGCVPPAVAVGGSPPGTPRDHAPPREQTPQHSPGTMHPYCGQTHACKHITLPQTSFAGGENTVKFYLCNQRK